MGNGVQTTTATTVPFFLEATDTTMQSSQQLRPIYRARAPMRRQETHHKSSEGRSIDVVDAKMKQRKE